MNEYYTDEEYQYALETNVSNDKEPNHCRRNKDSNNNKNKLKNFSKTARKLHKQINYHKHKQPNGHCNAGKVLKIEEKIPYVTQV